MTDNEIINERFDRIEKLAVELAISKIDAQNKIISRLEKEIKCKDAEIERLQSMNQANEESSTADDLKVVRCFECIYGQINNDINNTCYLTCRLSFGLRGTISARDYCSCGKRKE